MDRFPRRLRPFRAVLVLLGLLAAAECAARETVLRIALPGAYAPQVRQLAAAPPRCVDPPPACKPGLCAEEERACLRYRYAVGSDYQVLDWLQNGKVDGAVVPATTLELLKRALGDAFEAEFLVDRKLPLSALELRGYRLALNGDRGGLPLRDAQAELDALLRDLLDGQPRDDVVVDLPSHLSPVVPELFARARAAAEAKPGAEAASRHALMRALLPRLRFAAGAPARSPLRLRLSEEDGGPLADVMLVRRLALPEPLGKAESRLPPPGAAAAFLDDLAQARSGATKQDALHRFAAGNYVSESAGWRSRMRFSFTLDELHGILRSHAAPDTLEDEGIALVLTGGGVKAAWQTKLVDHLYGQGYLRNVFAPGEPDPQAVPVKYVVGTSGGALLGIFVASLDNAYPPPQLSTKLWYQHDENGVAQRLLSSADVFPLVDLMRWLSFVWCMVLFTAVCALLSLYLRRVRGYAPATVCDEASRFWRLSLPWLAVLAGTPWLLVYVNGRHGAEHIPAIQGGFYFVYLLIGVYSDHRFVVRAAPRQVRPGWPPLLLGLAGAGLVLAALFSDRVDPPIVPIGPFSLTLPALIACIGVLLACLAFHWWLSRSARWVEPVAREALPAFAFLVGVCAASYVLLFAATRLGLASMFELTSGFWMVLGAAALLASAASAWLAFGARVPWIRRRFDYLLAAHPSRCSDRLHWISSARYSRIILGLTAGWVWWNLIVAPGLYGNGNAQHYFQAAARNVFGERAVGAGAPTDLDVAFRAFYAAPVTALEKGVERYVMFQPREAYEPGAKGTQLAGYRSWLSIANDPRWLTIDSAEAQRSLVMRVAFASGSPFPVFPAHRIALPGIGEELLVDGGYAHNVPVEASKRLGARRVLVINSSPRAEPAAAQAGEGGFRYVGNLTWLLRGIIPYLYERSQVEDALSAEDLLVGLVAPSADPHGWPFLTDFRDEVIERLFAEAEKDRALRIGTIENWGRPAFTRRAVPAP